MSPKTTLVLMFVLLASISLAFFDPFRLKEKSEQKHELEIHLFWLKDKKLTELKVRNKNQEIEMRCAQKEGCAFDVTADWKMLAPIVDIADSANISSLTSSLLNLTPVDRLKFDSPPNLKEYGLDAPEYSMEIKVLGEAEPYKLSFGREAAVGPTMYAISNRLPNQILLIANYFPAALKKDLFYWRNKKVFSGLEVDQLTELNWIGPKGRMRFLKKEAKWQILEPIEARANQIMVEGLATTLAYAAAKDIFSDSKSSVQSKKIIASKPIWDFHFLAKDIPYDLSLFKSDSKDFIAATKSRDILYKIDPIVFDRFSKDIAEYRERKILPPEEKERLDEIHFHFLRDKKKLSLKMNGMNWDYLSGEKPAEPLSQKRISSFIDSLFSMDVQSFSSGPEYALFNRAIGDLELELYTGQKLIKKMRFMMNARRFALTEGEGKEVRVLGEDFLRLLPIRFSDLFESTNKQFVIPSPKVEAPHHGHDHSH